MGSPPYPDTQVCCSYPVCAEGSERWAGGSKATCQLSFSLQGKGSPAAQAQICLCGVPSSRLPRLEYMPHELKVGLLCTLRAQSPTRGRTTQWVQG